MTEPFEVHMEPIGAVAGAGDDVERQDWSRVRSEIRLQPEHLEALLGIEAYSHIIVIGWLHEIPDAMRSRRQAYPAGNDRFPLQGALALRGGARPNPVSFTVCRLLGIEGTTLRVEGLDLVDGTPVLDVKPYIAFYDSAPDASLPKWAQG